MALANRSFRWTKRIRIWRNHRVNLYDIGRIIFKNLRDLRLTERAAAISFSFLLAVPATLIFLFSLVPYLPLDSIQQTILETIKLLAPNQKLYMALNRTVLDLMQTKRQELISLGIFTTIFVSSGGVMGLLRSFDRKSPFHKERSGLARRAKSILLTLVFMAVLIISLSLLIIQSQLVNEYILRYFPYPVLIQVFSGVLLVVIIYLTICILYKYGPSLNQKFRFFSPGAIIATLLFFLDSYIFFFIADHFIHYNKIYGSIGTTLMIMVWIYSVSMVMLIGYEINLSIIIIDKGHKTAK